MPRIVEESRTEQQYVSGLARGAKTGGFVDSLLSELIHVYLQLVAFTSWGIHSIESNVSDHACVNCLLVDLVRCVARDSLCLFGRVASLDSLTSHPIVVDHRSPRAFLSFKPCDPHSQFRLCLGFCLLRKQKAQLPIIIIVHSKHFLHERRWSWSNTNDRRCYLLVSKIRNSHGRCTPQSSEKGWVKGGWLAHQGIANSGCHQASLCSGPSLCDHSSRQHSGTS